jgi:hypothetical protein
MIGPGGLLLVVPHPFGVPVSVLWGGVAKSKYITISTCKVPFLGVIIKNAKQNSIESLFSI